MAQAYDEAAVARAIASGEEPATAEEYINHVRYQARRIPDLMITADAETANVAVAVSDAAGAAGVPRPPVCVPPSRDVAWESALLAEFCALGAALAAWDAQRERRGAKLPAPPVTLPNVNDQSAWRAFCFGVPPPATLSETVELDGDDADGRDGPFGAGPMRGNIEDYPSSDEEESTVDYQYPVRCGAAPRRWSGGAASGTDDAAVGTLPSLAIVMSYDQIGAARVVRRAVAGALRSFDAAAAARAAWRPPPSERDAAARAPSDWHALGLLRPSECAWLYAFLARLEKPLLADLNAVIRQLFVLCRRQSATIAALCSSAGGAGGSGGLGSPAADGAWHNPAAVTLSSVRVLAVVSGRHFEQQLVGE